MRKTPGLSANSILPFAAEEVEMLKNLCPSLQVRPVIPTTITTTTTRRRSEDTLDQAVCLPSLSHQCPFAALEFEWKNGWSASIGSCCKPPLRKDPTSSLKNKATGEARCPTLVLKDPRAGSPPEPPFPSKMRGFLSRPTLFGLHHLGLELL